MSIIDTAINHFSIKGQKEIEVKEWNTVFYVKPLNLDEQRRLYEKSQNNQVEALVDLIIMKCLNEKGDKVFSLSDKQKLLTECDPNVITDLASRITNESSVVEEKKS